MTIEIIKKETTFLSDVFRGEVFSFADEPAEKNNIYIKLSADIKFRYRYADLKTGQVFATDEENRKVILPKVSKLVIDW